MLTAEERILLNLLAHVRRAERFEVPFEMTQAGIALSVSVRRSHVSATLAEMEKHIAATAPAGAFPAAPCGGRLPGGQHHAVLDEQGHCGLHRYVSYKVT